MNYGRLQYLILLFKIPVVTRRNFLEMYRIFGHAPSKISPAQDYSIQASHFSRLEFDHTALWS